MAEGRRGEGEQSLSTPPREDFQDNFTVLTDAGLLQQEDGTFDIAAATITEEDLANIKLVEVPASSMDIQVVQPGMEATVVYQPPPHPVVAGAHQKVKV